MKATGKNGGLPYDVAKVMLQMYKDVYVCISIKDCLWFYYDEDLHKWIEDDKGIRLKMKISTEVWDKFHKLQKEFDSKVTESGDENEIKRESKRIRKEKKDLNNKIDDQIISEFERLIFAHFEDHVNKS
jgi:hypothetical protein